MDPFLFNFSLSFLFSFYAIKSPTLFIIISWDANYLSAVAMRTSSGGRFKVVLMDYTVKRQHCISMAPLGPLAINKATRCNVLERVEAKNK